MKRYRVLNWLIRMFKILGVLGGIVTTLGLFFLLVITVSDQLRYATYAYSVWDTLRSWGGYALGISVFALVGYASSAITYGIGEFLDVLISIQQNTYASANVLRNMYQRELEQVHDRHTSQRLMDRLKGEILMEDSFYNEDVVKDNSQA